MGAAAIPIMVAVASTAATAVVTEALTPDEPIAPEPIAPPAPPSIPTQASEDTIDPSSVLDEEQGRIRTLKRRNESKTKGGSLSLIEDGSTSADKLTLLGK